MELTIALKGVLPAVAAAVVLLALLVQPWRKDKPHAWAALATGLAFALAYAVGHGSLVSRTFPPVTPVEWWPYAALGGVAALAGDLAFGKKWPASFALRAALSLALVYPILARFAEHYSWSGADLARLALLFAIPAASVSVLLERRASRLAIGDLAGIWIPAQAGFAFALFQWGSSTGTSSATVACAAGSVVATAACWSPRRTAPAGPIACGTILVAVTAATARYANDLPWQSFAPLAASPLAGLVPLGGTRVGTAVRWALAVALAALGAWLAYSLGSTGDSLDSLYG